jgi:hypothetical protein
MPTPPRGSFKDFAKLVKWEDYYLDHGHQPGLWKRVAEDMGMSKEERLWLAFLAVGYSHEGSTWVAYNRPGVRTRKKLPPADLKIAILRRNLYGGRITQHFQELYKIRSFTKWLHGVKKWPDLIKKLKTIYGNGNWAAYTTAETLVTVADLDIQADETGFVNNTGPRKALELLGFEPSERGVLGLLAKLRDYGVDVPVQLLETVMCYWQNLQKGKFYIGRSIDRQQNQIEYAEEAGVDCDCLWEARRKVFRLETLGEVNGWPGLDKERLKHYKRTGELLLPTEMREL